MSNPPPGLESAAERPTLFQRLLGDHARIGAGIRAVQVAREAEYRNRMNWILPGLCILMLLGLLIAHKIHVPEQSGAGGMIARIFVFDYLVFLFGGLSGWNMARRWRNTADQVEEISLTPLPPRTVGHLLVAGPVRVWFLMILIFTIMDTLTPATQVFAWTDISSSHSYKFGFIPFFAISALLVPVVLGWFHLESVRLAHWMFAIHALPKISLATAAVSNFFFMTFFVAGLSMIGSAGTAAAVLVLSMIGAVFGSNGFEYVWGSYSFWSIGAAIASLFIIWMKRQLCRNYERKFGNAFLLYQWWGAGEATQPSVYPRHLWGALALWEAYFGMQEEEAAGRPPHRRPKTALYYKMLAYLHNAAAQQQPVTSFQPPPPAQNSPVAGAAPQPTAEPALSPPG